MIDPVEAFKTTSLLVPTSTHTALPTVVPTPPHYELIGNSGKQALWVVFVIMLLSTITIAWLAFRVPAQKRLFHILTVFITTFTTIAYFAMATGDGNTFTHIRVHHAHKNTPDVTDHIFRQVFWARYVNWSVTTPFILLDLAFLAGVGGANILVTVIVAITMTQIALFASLAHSDAQRWGYFAMAIVAFLVILYQLIVPGRRAAVARQARTARLYTSIAGYVVIVWILYPVVWALGAGARKLTVDSEVILFAVLDVLVAPVFGFWLLLAHGRSAASIEGFWSHGLADEGSIRIDDDGA